MQHDGLLGDLLQCGENVACLVGERWNRPDGTWGRGVRNTLSRFRYLQVGQNVPATSGFTDNPAAYTRLEYAMSRGRRQTRMRGHIVQLLRAWAKRGKCRH